MLAKRLKELRAKKGVNQSKLAAEMGVTQGTVGKWETNRRNPNTKMLQKLADYFSVTIDYLVGHEDSVPELAVLARKISRLPQKDKDKIIEYFSETMDDYLKKTSK